MTRPALVALSELVESVATWNPLRAEPDDVFSYVDLSAVDQDAKRIVAARETACAEAPSRARQLVATDDVLVSTVRPNLNGVAQVTSDLDGATASTGFCVLRSKAAKLDASYLFQWVKSPSFVGDMVRKATGASYPAVSDRIIGESLIPLPPLAEQRRIAAILDQAEALRAQRRAAIAQLDSLGQAIFLEMFGDPVTNPHGLSMSSVGNVAEVQGGLQVTAARKDLPLELPYLRVANVYRGYLDLREIKTIRATNNEVRRTLLQRHDLLVVEGHGNPNEIGRSALWTAEISECIHQNHLIRVRFDPANVLPAFGCEYLNSPGGRQHLLRAGKTTTGLNTISVGNVRETPIALPPLHLQHAFAQRMHAIAKLKRAHRDGLERLDELFASLQHRAFRGELQSSEAATEQRRTSSAVNFESLRRLESTIGLEALIFVAKELPAGRHHHYKTLKVLYFADRRHLEKHGCFIYGETHSALPHGPVPQAAYDATRVLNGERLFSDFDDDALRAGLRRVKNDREDRLIPLRSVDADRLGSAAIESLEWAIRYCSEMSFDQVKAASHDTAYDRTESNMPIPVKYLVDMLPPEARKRHWDLETSGE